MSFGVWVYGLAFQAVRNLGIRTPNFKFGRGEMGVSKKQVCEYRPQDGRTLIIRTPKKRTSNL